MNRFVKNSLLLVALSTEMAFAQSAELSISNRLAQVSEPAKDSPTDAVAASTSSVQVSKTAYVDGQNVCGEIRITNGTRSPAITRYFADTLEVHFPSTVSSPALPAGSTPNWFIIAFVPVVLPATIPSGQTVAIDYCFPLCAAASYAGANSMRNVITFAFATREGRLPNVVNARSVSFPPPTFDCQACCKPNGDCADTVPDDCAAAGGSAKGIGTDCATTECTQACCRDGTCSDEILSGCQSGGEPQGFGTDCGSTECPQDCCLPNEFGACANERPSDCIAAGGRPLAGAVCGTVPNPCPRACCLGDGSCLDRSVYACETDNVNPGTPQGPLTVCVTTECPEACCLPNEFGSCANERPSDCIAAGGRTLAGARCGTGPNPCPRACCVPGEGCSDLTGIDCAYRQGDLQGPLTECATTQCPETCCLPDGSCADERPSDCIAAGGRTLAGALCGTGPNPCPRACCLGDGSCLDRSVYECVTDNVNPGTPQGPGTTCATTECPQACCGPGESCDDRSADECIAQGGEPQGAGTACATTQCCLPLGTNGCAVAATDCCAGSCVGGVFSGSQCCFELGATGCSADADCCLDNDVCDAGTCCIPFGAAGCDDSTDCCTGSCHHTGSFPLARSECCFELGATGCSADADCCLDNDVCDAGTCCLPIGAGGCSDSTDCCAGSCRHQSGFGGRSKCCPELGPTGCSADADCCFDSEVCDAGKCCLPIGFVGCSDSVGCCAGVCDSAMCCIPFFGTGCSEDFDCCSGLICTNGRCEGVVGP